MPTSHALLRPRWLLLGAVWLACAALVVFQTVAVRDYLSLLEEAAGPGASDKATPLRQLIPARHADSQMWVRHALAAQEAGEARTRFTTIDNAPEGRAVHWSSSIAWLLRAGSHLTGATGPEALERTLVWFNAPLFLAVLVGLSAWAAHRAGTAAGVVLALGMLGHPRFYETFAPTNVDHHGLLAAAVLGLLLGLWFMGMGWRTKTPAPKTARGGNPAVDPANLRPESRFAAAPSARRAAIVSALFGAFGLWISAATVLPVIAFAGAMAFAFSLWRGTSLRSEGVVFEPGLWRLWGAVGAGASIVFWLIEYAPAHLGLRLEVNHPLHALLWWGGAELVALGGAWAVARPPAWRVALAVVSACAAPLAILIGGRAVFAVGDPFVGELRHFVAEGKSLPAIAAQFGLRFVAFDLASCALLVVGGLVLWRRRDRAALAAGVLTLVVGALTAMSVMEMRWWQNTGAAQLALLLPLLALVPAARRSAACIAVGALLVLPAVGRVALDRADNRRGAVSATDLAEPLYRDLAAALRRDQPGGAITLLASPNASAGIGYYARCASLGTLYWENTAGLRAAAEIFCATTDAEAERLLRARRVTHVAHLSAANFLGEYLQLLRPQAGTDEARRTLGYRLATGGDLPRWLQPIPYRRPPGLKEAMRTARLYRVAFDQTDAERLFWTALALAAEGDFAAAEKILAEAGRRTPPAEHAKFFAAAGAAFHDFGADALAIRTLQRSGRDDATLAWILATTRDEGLRDGRAALALIEPLARAAPADAAILSAQAAALAELGRFPEAIGIAERALAAADANAAEPLRQRLAAYRAGRPWRQ